MKKFILFLFILPSMLFAQQEGFVTIIDGGAQEIGYSCIVDGMLGSWICAGSTDSYGAGGKDCYLVFINMFGDTIFTNTYGTANDEVALSICDFGQQAKGILRLFGGYQINTDKDIYFHEIDYNGVTQYPPKTIDWGYGDDELTRLRYLTLGYAYGTGYVTNQYGDRDMIFLEIEDNYIDIDTTYTALFGGTGDEAGNDITMDSKWGYPTIAGYSTSFGTGDQDVYIVSYDPFQSMVNWYKSYGGTGNDAAKVILYDDFFYNFIVAGYTESFGAGGKDIYVLKLDEYGDTIWTKTYGNILDDEPYDMVKYDTTYVISGYTTNPATLDKDMYILTISAFSGAVIDEKIIGDELEDEIAYGIIQTSCYNYIVGDDNSDLYFSETNVIDLNIAQTNISCFGNANGAIEINPSGGSTSITTLWRDTASNTIDTNVFMINNLAPNAYILDFSDDGRVCMYTDTFIITEPPLLVADTTVINASCGGACDGIASVNPIGGTIPYLYNWSTGETDSLILSVCAGTIDVTVTDLNGCQTFQSVIIDESALGIINGTVNPTSYGPIPDDSATVYLLKSYGPGDIDTLDITNLLSSSYQFADVFPGTYIIKINIAEGLGYDNVLNSYHDTTYTWGQCLGIDVDCDSVINITTTMFEMVPMGAGNGIINGMIGYYDGTKSMGEPVPGAEVYIEQEPNDEPIASTQTDTAGYYEFLDVELGLDYKLFVDIPGFPLISTHSNIDITSTDTLFENLNFYVDTTSGNEGIYVDTLTTIANNQIINVSYKIYPNPFSDNLNIDYIINNNATVSLDIIDIKGELIKTILVKQNQDPGSYHYQFNNISKGTYFIKLKIDNNVFIKKVIAVK